MIIFQQKKHRFLNLVLAVILGGILTGTAFADATSSNGAARHSSAQGEAPAAANSILHIATTGTTTSIQQALTDLGLAFDLVNSDDWSVIDLSPYKTVIIGMDGGGVEGPSVQNVANFVSAGGLLIIVGGTNYQPFVDGVNTYLLLNDTANHGWTISSTPHLTVIDASSPLAVGLPSTYTFADSSAAFYMLRSLDSATSVAAVNGDGVDALFSKTVGSGTLVWFINSAQDYYWGNAGDFAVLKTVIHNALEFVPSKPVMLITPNGGETLHKGSTFMVTWSSDGVTDPVYTTRLQYNCGGGWTTFAVIGGNPGSYGWAIPKKFKGGSACKAKVHLRGIGGRKIAGDTSDESFSIVQ